MNIPKTITKEEYLRLVKNKGDANVGEHDKRASGNDNETGGRETTVPDNDRKNGRRAADKDKENFEVRRENAGEIEQVTSPPTEEEYTCDDCGNPIKKHQEKCDFCGCTLNWEGIA